jgi:hypothetical protein
MDSCLLTPAYKLNCSSCHKTSYHDPQIYEFSSDEADEIEERTGIRPVCGDWVSCPSIVECPHCHVVFEIDPEPTGGVLDV